MFDSLTIGKYVLVPVRKVCQSFINVQAAKIKMARADKLLPGQQSD